MPNQDQLTKIREGRGFIAALDQSGGSTPFTGDQVIGAILFEMTMEREIDGKPTATYMWEERGVVPFLKVDKGLADEENGAQVMKPMPDLDALCERAVKAGIFGTKMRSVISAANQAGVDAVVAQQFEVGKQILSHGLVPIMLKLTLPEVANHYKPLVDHPRVLRVVALSGGYSRDEANARLAQNTGVIASFSRALTEGLSAQQSDAEFNSTIAATIQQIYDASVAG